MAIIIDVHARDIVDKFVRDSILDAREFAWESQLRFYWCVFFRFPRPRLFIFLMLVFVCGVQGQGSR